MRHRLKMHVEVSEMMTVCYLELESSELSYPVNSHRQPITTRVKDVAPYNIEDRKHFHTVSILQPRNPRERDAPRLHVDLLARALALLPVSPMWRAQPRALRPTELHA